MGKNNTKLSTKEFINRAIRVHNNKYNYSLVNYINSHTKVNIICSVHGEFSQIPKCHLKGYNCPKCSKHMFVDKNEFVKRAMLIHNNKYDYSLVNYKNTRTDIKIICKIHGEFIQKPENHISGQGCPKCGRINQIKNSISNNNEFVCKAKQVHNDKYDYSKSDYKGVKVKLKIICKNGHEFYQTPNDHLCKHGCPFCTVTISEAHEELIDFIKEDKIINDREVIKPYELDIFIKNKKLAIEYNGLYWHNDEFKNKNYHHNKASICFDKGIQLIQIFENEWLNKKEIVKSILNSKLGINNKIFARKCEIKELTLNEFNDFCYKNHIQGKLNSTIRLGLINNNKLVCVIGFNKHSKYDYECTRFCNELNINVIGGASRLFKYFLNKYQPSTILSFADRRYSNGGLYKQLGFELVGITKPNYFYFKNGSKILLSRQSFQKHRLKNKLDTFNNFLSEYVNMINNGYKRIWDAGHWKFIWSKIH